MLEGQIDRIVGFDLGHGETALACVKSDGTAGPKMLEINKRKSQITALALDQRRGAIIGEDAFRLPGAQGFTICFKSKPSKIARDQREAIQKFVETVHRILIDEGQIAPGGGTLIIVGCPSGWSMEERLAYKKLLAVPGMPCLEVEPESRAAYWDSTETELTREEEEKPVLVIDLGSSTTDFTLVRERGRYNEALNTGLDLGAALIDQTILAQTLAAREDRDTLERIFQEHPHHKYRCELYCRRAKEEYFTSTTFYREADQEVHVGQWKIQPGLVFRPLVTGPVMQEVLDQPLDELDGKGWRQAFGDEVRAIRDEIDRKHISLGVVVLTGGASRMDFVKQVCEEIFPDSRHVRDSEPEYTIAKGLSRYGRRLWQVDSSIRAFLHEVDDFIQRELPTAVETERPKLLEAMAETLTDGLAEDVLKSSLQAWREGKIDTLDQLETRIRYKVKRWVKSKSTKDQISRTVDAWLRPIAVAIEGRLRTVYDKYEDIAFDSLASIFDDMGGRATKLEGISIGDPAVLNEIIEKVGMAVVWAVLFTLEATVAGFGPIGWITGIVIGIVAWAYGTDKATEYLKGKSIPIPPRKLLLSEKKIDKFLSEQRQELKSSLYDMLNQDPGLKEELSGKVSQRLQAVVEKSTDHARSKLLAR